MLQTGKINLIQDIISENKYQYTKGCLDIFSEPTRQKNKRLRK